VPEPQDFLALALDVDGAAEFRRFRGGFVIDIEDGRLSLTNNTSLEEYVAGVVGAEMPASWPLEALKAQAIASRSFALHALLGDAERGRRTILGSGESFQVYRGLEAEDPRVLEAVRATRGEVLAFRGRLVRTSFHSTCGGRTRNAWEVFADPKVDCYRGVECQACAGSRRALWTGQLSAEEVESALAPWLANRGIRLGALSCIEVSERDEGGAVRYLRLSDGRVSFELSGVRFRALLLARGIDRVRSCAYDVVTDSGQFVFGGRGWGHGVGMCQVGAGRLGRTLSSREILSTYYPSSEVMVVY
jgi:stage II sporulation protein D